jgi:hypothetical protein
MRFAVVPALVEDQELTSLESQVNTWTPAAFNVSPAMLPIMPWFFKVEEASIL